MDLLLGLGLLLSHQHIDAPDAAYMATITTAERQATSVQPQAFLELRDSGLGLVLSYGQSARWGHATATRDGVYADITQDISAKWAAVSAAYTHVLGQWEVQGSLGVAQVWGSNYERGWYSGVWVEQRNETRERVPVFGLGLQYWPTERLGLRLNVQRMNNVVRSHWTSHSDITAWGAALVWRY